MSNFNAVFLAIKKHCEKQLRFAEIHSFETIAKEANVPLSMLGIYLNHLQGIGLIKYSMVATDKYIFLTSLGKKQESLTKE